MAGQDEKDEDLDEVVRTGMLPVTGWIDIPGPAPEITIETLSRAWEGDHEPDDPRWRIRDFGHLGQPVFPAEESELMSDG